MMLFASCDSSETRFKTSLSPLLLLSLLWRLLQLPLTQTAVCHCAKCLFAFPNLIPACVARRVGPDDCCSHRRARGGLCSPGAELHAGRRHKESRINCMACVPTPLRYKATKHVRLMQHPPTLTTHRSHLPPKAPTTHHG